MLHLQCTLFKVCHKENFMKKYCILLILFACALVSIYSLKKFTFEKGSGSRSGELAYLENSVENTEKKYKILVLWEGLGEYECSKRVELACEKLGWEAKNCHSREQLPANEKLMLGSLEKNIHESIIPASQIPSLVEEFQPDFTISMKDNDIFAPDIPNYIAITGAVGGYFDPCFSPNAEMLNFDGYLCSSLDYKHLKVFVENSGKKFNCMDWYQTCCSSEYQPVTPKKLFYCGFQWDKKRSGSEYTKMFSLLDQRGYLEVYGPPNCWWCAPHSIRGLIPFDGESLFKPMKEAGIALILHAQSHLTLGAPTGRIFEAASVGDVIISDKNPFVLKEFGDSVLYIDVTTNGTDLFKQIDAHVRWIFSHPKEAEEMARKAHSIFVNNFTMEKQLLQLAQMHENILKDRMQATK